MSSTLPSIQKKQEFDDAYRTFIALRARQEDALLSFSWWKGCSCSYTTLFWSLFAISLVAANAILHPTFPKLKNPRLQQLVVGTTIGIMLLSFCLGSYYGIRACCL